MRFENTYSRYDENRVIGGVLDILGLPSPPAGMGRACAELFLKLDSDLAAALPTGGDPRQQRERIEQLLQLLDVAVFEPTADQIGAQTQAGLSLCVASVPRRFAIEIHAGVGVIFHRGKRSAHEDTLYSEIAPITGSGMDQRRAYLVSIIDVTRDALERSFS